MASLWTLYSLLLCPIFTLSLICKETDNCGCHKGNEIQCPPNNYYLKGDKVVIHVENEKTTIDCSFEKKFRLDLLPNITLPETTRLEMNGCFMPSQGFKTIFDHFSMTKIKVLYFLRPRENVTLTKQSFGAFSDDFNKLKLEWINFTHLDDDLFSMTPNLLSLEIERNRNFTLVSSLFQNLTKMTAMWLGDNALEVVPDGTFDNLVSLSILHLWGNRLKFINETTFGTLRNLTQLELSSNQIETVSENSFQSLRKLKAINLSANKLMTIPRYVFKNNKKLEQILLANNPGLRVPDYLFANLPILHKVDLSYCKITSLPKHIFENSSSLAILDLQFNKLSHVSPLLFQGLVHLTHLYLAENLLESIEKDSFESLTQLEEIDLRQNRIRSVDSSAFADKPNLKKIILSHNEYSGDDTGLGISQECPSVKHLDLSYNVIVRVNDVISPYHTNNLKKLDLSNNLIAELTLTDLQSTGSEMSVYLVNNNITRVNFDNVDIISSQGVTRLFLANNPINCDCHSYKLFQFLEDQRHIDKPRMFKISTENLICKSPQNLKGHDFVKLSPFQLMCPMEKEFCPSNCSCDYTTHSRRVMVDCSFKNLTQYPTFGVKTKFAFKETEMNLTGNSLTKGPSGLEGYNNVTKLDLSSNRIENLEWLPPKLKMLRLDDNNLSHLEFHILETLEKSDLLNLTLGANPWTCDCTAINLTNFLRQHSKILMDTPNIKCYDNPDQLLVNQSEEELCPNRIISHVVIPVLVFLLFLASLFTAFTAYKQEIKIWLFAHNLCLYWVTEEELDKDKTYDAFISYSHKDEDFVVQNLLPVLEGDQSPYKLCLHYRNFIPGVMITTQITNAVLDSRRTLVVLSANFLESVWGRMEFRTAHTHAMEEGRTRVIIVLLGDVDVDKLDEELRSYLKTNTYVKWGDPYFWNKLRYALPHCKRKVKGCEQKMANVMRSIDDKFTLVVEDKPNPDSTPPVLAFDGDVKKNPLEFVVSEDLSTPPAEAGTLMVSTVY